MKIKILLLFAIFALSSQGIAYAAEADLATNKETEIVEVVQNETNNSIDIARHPQMIIKLRVPHKLEKNDMMRTKMFDI